MISLCHFLPDGSLLAFLRLSPKLSFDIWTLTIGKDGKPGEARPLLDSAADENHAQFSPDGKWLAYSSNESGRFEVLVRGYPTGGKWQVSADGGDEPRWSPTGSELFFRNGSKMMTVPVETAPAFSAATPRLLFDKKFEDVGWVLDYDVARDGKRFLMIQAVPQTGGSGQLNVILNWAEELRQRSPSAQR